jgi:hypothetical protein
MSVIARPDTEEFAAEFARYVARAPVVSDAARQLAFQGDALVSLLSPLSEAQAAFRYAPDKWSVKEVLGHLCDAERIFAYRLLRIGRGDQTPLPGFDENAYVPAAAIDRRPLREVLEDWSAVRDATVTLVRGMPDEGWTRRGVANGHPISARALLYIVLGHVEHHRAVLAERYKIT